MRLTSVTLHSSPDQEDIELSVREGSFAERYVVRQILGIDAEELIPKFYGTGIVSGKKFHDRVMKPREIVLLIALNPAYTINETVSKIRDRLYRLISTNRTGLLELHFKSGPSIVGTIQGMITKFEVGHFAQLPQVQITITCPDPTFRSAHPIDYDPADIPTTNPIMLPDSASTAHHGFSFKVEFTAATASFTIQDAPSSPDWFWRVTPIGGFDIGDELWFSSEYGAKLVFLNSTSDAHLMNQVDPASIWPTIFPGENEFYFLDIANFDWLELTYFSAYWGV